MSDIFPIEKLFNHQLWVIDNHTIVRRDITDLERIVKRKLNFAFFNPADPSHFYRFKLVTPAGKPQEPDATVLFSQKFGKAAKAIEITELTPEMVHEIMEANRPPQRVALTQAPGTVEATLGALPATAALKPKKIAGEYGEQRPVRSKTAVNITPSVDAVKQAYEGENAKIKRRLLKRQEQDKKEGDRLIKEDLKRAENKKRVVKDDVSLQQTHRDEEVRVTGRGSRSRGRG